MIFKKEAKWKLAGMQECRYSISILNLFHMIYLPWLKLLCLQRKRTSLQKKFPFGVDPSIIALGVLAFFYPGDSWRTFLQCFSSFSLSSFSVIDANCLFFLFLKAVSPGHQASIILTHFLVETLLDIIMRESEALLVVLPFPLTLKIEHFVAGDRISIFFLPLHESIRLRQGKAIRWNR